MSLKNSLTQLLNLDFPVIMAPMFLVSNTKMVKVAMKTGIAGTFPALNYRNENELEKVLDELNAFKATISTGTYGVNLIAQKTNPLLEKHLQACVSRKVPFYITSLGNPKEIIDKAHAYGAKVFCDVVNIEYAKKCADLNCDGFIAVGQGAGGHAGPFPLQVLVPSLKKNFPNIPIVAAGGIANGAGILSVLALGASGSSIGTRFIASEEANVNAPYKDAVVNAGMEDIVMTTKISGSPCNIINTPYARKIGYTQNFIERYLSHHPKTKKWFKMLVQYRGMKKLERSVLPANYQTLWCAGQSVELINEILPCEDIIKQLKSETSEAIIQLNSIFK